MNDYYVYLHKKASNGAVFYVGKGKKNRAFHFNNRSTYWNRVAYKHGVNVEIVFSGLTNSQAIYLEKKMIQKFGLVNLTNLTPGGEGVSAPWSSETRDYRIQSIRQACSHPEWIRKNRAWTSSERYKRIRSAHSKRMHADPEFKERHRQSMKKAANTKENKDRVSRQWKGVDRGKEFSRKLSKANKGKIFSDSHVENMRNSQSHKMKRVECIDTEETFDSVFYARKWLESKGVATKSCEAQIRHVCKGRSVTACGYKWRYVT